MGCRKLSYYETGLLGESEQNFMSVSESAENASENLLDYYPFGKPMPGRQYVSAIASKRFGYQGQFAEADEETGWNSFYYREYDSEIGRFTSYDPMEEFHSPYEGMGNNPVSLYDPTGGKTGGGGGIKWGKNPGSSVGGKGAALTKAPRNFKLNLNFNFNLGSLLSGFMNATNNMVHLEDIDLGDGNVVKVRFMDSRDGRTSDNPVDPSLKNAFEGAIKEANKKVRIKSVLVTATTNGRHGKYSRHYSGKGVDLGAVNGEAIRPGQESVAALQLSFENQSGRRENFGPEMMRKSGGPYIHDGLTPEKKAARMGVKNKHKTHIHWSVN